ncbi:hypothetical protein CDL12_14410 [Handroanthus impetiginosus]|uniref:Uncharacterized protein n=1 Tax=Handroanthus impetiginosus TaxID=429701 RepID=A0A2G9H626_9LAMI|nr:hypothetical protein CDL12_14410 [Handroanthus impetiginosus]
MRLPGDSGRFSASDIQIFRPDCGFSSARSPTHSATKRAVSAGINQSSSRAVK